jgi:succinate dehydrogenase hydrophobic anchor subunit
MPWCVDVLAGVALGALLYWLVRFRMSVAPRMRDRFGNWARWTTWLVVLLLMILVANLELLGLRQLLHDYFELETIFVHEALFALVALAFGYWLVSRYATRNRRSNSKENCIGGKPK